MDDAKREMVPDLVAAAVEPPARRGSLILMSRLNSWTNPLVQLTLARLREFLREPEAVFWVFVFPALLAVALGIAFRNTAPEKLRIAVVASQTANQSGSPATTAASGGQQVTTKVANALSGSVGLVGVVLSPSEAAEQLRTGKVAMIVRATLAGEPAPAIASGRLAEGNTTRAAAVDPSLDYQFDPTRPESRVARLSVDDALQRAFGRTDVAKARDHTVVERGARYIDFLIPGLIGLNLLGTGMWGIGFTVVNARTRKLLKRFAATPMRRSHYLLALMLSRLMFLFLEVSSVVAFGWIAFGVAVRGSFITLAILSILGAMCFAGIGLLVAARPKTVEGVSGIMNVVMMPMWLLCGSFFSYSRFPEFVQPVIKALPLTALNDSLRAVMNDGASIRSMGGPIAVMIVWGVVCFMAALRIFRWQ
ncbi:MAG TPA: ABC transporter permease [Blastocatellia bacterium]|nr:ABC transporter permease [Blastocatellia bacterium]